MTADTTTPNLGLLLQGTGNNNNAWGQDLNDQVFSRLDKAVAGMVTVATTGGTYTLSADEALAAYIRLTGTLTSDLVLVVPDTDKIYNIINSTDQSGGFFTRLKCATAAAAASVPGGFSVTTVFVMGALPQRADASLCGSYVYGALASPGCALECDGALYKRTALPSLFSLIGTTFGSTDSTNFRVPLASDTGRFLRSRAGAVTAGTSQANQNKSHTHTGSGSTSTESANHTHTGSGTTAGASNDHTHNGSGTTSIQSADHTHTGSGATSGQSVNHTHSGTTAGASNGHTHTGSGATSAMSANAAHTHALGGAQNAFVVSVTNGGGASQGNLVCTSASVSAGLTTSSANIDHTHTYSFTTSDVSADHNHSFTSGTVSADHTHTYSFTTSGISANHTHTYSFTTAGVSADHTHAYSFTTSTQSATHTHTYSFTTSTGSADGTEARPESLVAVLCIRY